MFTFCENVSPVWASGTLTLLSPLSLHQYLVETNTPASFNHQSRSRVDCAGLLIASIAAVKHLQNLVSNPAYRPVGHCE